MKKFIRSALTNIFNPIIIRLGYVHWSNITPEKDVFGKNSLLGIFFKNIELMGFVPKHIIDIGANHGTWTREMLKYFPDAYYTLVEPQEWLKTSLQDLLDSNKKMTFNAFGAGSKAGAFMFTIVKRDDSCSFRYSKAEAEAKGFEQVEIPIITLNDIAEKYNSLPFPDLVKIDAEGLDIDVLEGASDLIGKTEVFLVEAAVFNKEFQNSLLRMINYMDEKGYVLFDITDLNRALQANVLWLVELVFIKKGGIIDSYKVNF